MRFPDRLPIPDDVLGIARKLEDAGFETWCVGGAVRDNLLTLENQDFDLTTAATPEDVQRLFRRTIPIGVEHGTVAVLDRNNEPHEVTTFRRDVETDGRHAVVAFGVSLDDDLARRDFTINAMAYHPLRHEWRDRFGGAEDLERRVIRAVGDPAQRFREDYLRILRALRFAARFGFQIDRDTWDAATANVAGLKQLSAERVRDEWFKGIHTARWPSGLLALWRDVGGVEMWLPEIGHRETGNLKVGTGAIDELPPDPVLITSYLSVDPVATLTRLKCSNAEIERGRRIAEHRQAWPEPVSEAAVRRWLAGVGPAADDLLNIAEAEGWGDVLVETAGRVARSKAPLSLGDLAITGDDLLAAAVPRGPAVGQALRMLLDRVLEDPSLNTREKLLELAATSPVSRRTSHPARRKGKPK
jgi:tRNA nucleotidyltransferase (CCA-adding enzyme)